MQDMGCVKIKNVHVEIELNCQIHAHYESCSSLFAQQIYSGTNATFELNHIVFHLKYIYEFEILS